MINSAKWGRKSNKTRIDRGKLDLTKRTLSKEFWWLVWAQAKTQWVEKWMEYKKMKRSEGHFFENSNESGKRKLGWSLKNIKTSKEF